MTHVGHVEGHSRAGARFRVLGQGLLAPHKELALPRIWGPFQGPSSTGLGRPGHASRLPGPAWAGPSCLQPLTRWGPGENAARKQVGQKSMFPCSELPPTSHKEERATQSLGGKVLVGGSDFS